MMKRFLWAVLVVLLGILLFSCESLQTALASMGQSISDATSSIGSSLSSAVSGESKISETDPEQVKEIKTKWNEYRPQSVKQIYIEKPNVGKPYAAGSLTPEFLQNGLNTTKFVRYLAGLSENVVMTDELNNLGQHGAVILAKLGYLTHTPSKPSDMDQAFFKKAYESTSTANIHQSGSSEGPNGDLVEAVKGFCDDSDVSNIDRLGHRRWVLNPTLRKTGFGFASSYSNGMYNSFSPMQVIDKNNTEKADVPYVLWPNKGYFPVSFFENTQAWSVSLNPDSYDIKKCNPSVKLTCLDNGKEWVFSSKDKDKNGKYYNVEKTGFGLPYCIIFRPDGVSYRSNKKYKVEIGGLVKKSGEKEQLVYEVEFFSL
jgi:uncharacterized protein YkwD